MAFLERKAVLLGLLVVFWSCEDLQPPTNPADPILVLGIEAADDTGGDTPVDDPDDDLPPVVGYGENEPFHYVTLVYENWPDYGFIERVFQAVYWQDNDLSEMGFNALGFKSAGWPPITWVDVEDGSWLSDDLLHYYDVMYTDPESYWYDIPRLLVRSETHDGVQGPVWFQLDPNPYDKSFLDVLIAKDGTGSESLSLRAYIEAESGRGSLNHNRYKVLVGDIQDWSEYTHLKIVFNEYDSSFFRFR